MKVSAACCIVAISPVRSEASDASEMVTQLLFGEVVEVLERSNEWVKVRSYFDHYEGWTDQKHLLSLSEKEVNRWLDGLNTEATLYRTVQTPWGKQRITRGAFVPVGVIDDFQIGNTTFRLADSDEDIPSSVVDMALDYVGAPYLWGGKSPFGIDCSGLMQVTHRLFGINLPRDAWQQEEIGMTIPFGEQKRGDLAFFVNSKGRIHHVGLLLNATEIVHASGWVRVDDFSERGITRRTDGELSHRFYSIKRL